MLLPWISSIVRSHPFLRAPALKKGSGHMRILHTKIDLLQLDSVIYGHYVYKNKWSSMLGKELECIRNIRNVHDLYGVGVVKTGTGTVSYLPKKISLPVIMNHLLLAKHCRL